MGSLTTPMKWTSEDDARLKNAVEAGASLESFSKGAVRFSQSFTVQELLERWYSILHHYDISAEACVHPTVHPTDIVTESSYSTTTKASRAFSLKGKGSASTKRKLDSVQSHYYATRKRISSEHRLLNSAFLLHHFSLTNSDDGSNFQNQHSVGNMSLGQEDLLTCYGHPDSLYDEDMLRFDSVASRGNDAHNSFDVDYAGSIQVENPEKMVEPGCINRYNGSTCVESFEKSQMNNAHQPFEKDFVQKDPSLMLQDNIVSLDVFSDGNEVRLTEILVKNNLSDSDIIEIEALSGPGSDNEDLDGFTGKSDVSLQIAQYAHACTSPAVELPLWRAV